MELVKNLEDMIANAKRADKFLHEGSVAEKEFMLKKICNGRCFVVFREGENYKFYPSKYIGYKDNNPSSYEKAMDEATALRCEGEYSGDATMYDFDGRMSNRAINKILKCKCEKDFEFSEKFILYCEKLGLKGSEKMKFWKNIIEL